MTTVLVTGVTGQDGTILCKRLLGEGHDVHGLAFTQAEADAWAPEGVSEVRVHLGDLGDVGRTAEIVDQLEPDEIYNLGGQSSVAASWDDPVGTLRSTGVGAVGVFEAAIRVQQRHGRPVRVLQPSSAEIFGSAVEYPQTESTSIRPTSPYGAAKALAHQMSAVYRSRGLHVTTVVLYNHESVIRPFGFVSRKISSSVARIAHEGQGTLALGNLDARRDWGWAEDYVDAMVLALRHSVADDFVIATGQSHTVAEFVAAAFATVGISQWRDHVVVDEQFVRPADPSLQVGDATKAREQLGWRATTTFAEIAERMVTHDLQLLRSGALES